jgi:hypothetical protein
MATARSYLQGDPELQSIAKMTAEAQRDLSGHRTFAVQDIDDTA